MGQVSLEDILITDELSRRANLQVSSPTAKLKAENAALRMLARQLVEHPQTMLKTLVTIAKDLCQAGTAGVSLLEKTTSGEERFRWVALAGELEHYEQGTIPRQSSPCGICLDRRSPQLYSYPDRYFTTLASIEPPIVEALTIPLVVASQALGVIWIVSHDPQCQFDADDARVMSSLADFTAAALYNHQARQAAESAQTLLHLLLEHVPEGITVAGGPPDFPLIANSKLAQEWLGRSEDVLIGMASGEHVEAYGLFLPDGVTRHTPEQLPLYRATHYGETIRDEECIVERPDGTRIIVNANVAPVRNTQGEIIGAINCWRDITERKQIEAELQRREAELSLITNSVPVLIAFVDTEQRYRFNNRAYEEWFGCPAAEVYGKTLWEVLGETAYQTIQPYVEQALSGQQVTFEGEVPYQHAGTRYVNGMYIPRLNAQGVVEGFVAFVSDISPHRQAELALRNSEQRLRFAQQAAKAGVWDWDIVTNQVTWSQEYYALYGLNPHTTQPSYENWLSSIASSDRDRVDRITREALEHQRDLNVEFRVVHPIHGERWLTAIGQTFYDANHRPTRMSGIALDITERKRAELEREQLLAREHHYVNQLQGLTTAALAINAALSVEQVLQVITNQAAAIIGAHQSVTSITVDQNWSQSISSIYLSDKYAAWREYNEKPDGSGIYACVCHLNRPMRMTQAELEAHPRWKGFGQAADKHPPMRGWLAAPLVAQDGQNIGLIQLSDKYEGDFTETDEAILVQLAQMASGVIEKARLYEAEHQARSAAEASREEAQAANRIKDEFLAVLSHELRTPLNPILGWSKLLRSRQYDAATTARALETIERNAKLQTQLIEDLLDISRILRGKLRLENRPVDLSVIISAAIETVWLAANTKAIQIHTHIDAMAGTVSGDPDRLQQVIWNLLSNAVKFTPPGGRVEVRLEQVVGNQREYTAASPHPHSPLPIPHYAQIRVTDTGQGIDPEFLPYLFEYFRQADSATTRKFGGLGLGLAIARHIVELHGGVIAAASPGEGQGATFVVRLPLLLHPNPQPIDATGLQASSSDANQTSTPEVSQSILPLPLNGLSILIVDDETDSLEYLRFVLEQFGATVTAVASALDAMQSLTTLRLDVLISDIGMPEVDGYMLIRQLRQREANQGTAIPAIALTAYAGEINQQKALDSGFQCHLSKPVEPTQLVETIVALVRSK
jgi:PAS domain S-box-containing protein